MFHKITDILERAEFCITRAELEREKNPKDISLIVEMIRDHHRHENLARYMEFLGWTEAAFLGSCPRAIIPISVGQRITIPAGVPRFMKENMGDNSPDIVRRNHKIMIKHITYGREAFNHPRDYFVENPMVYWNSGVLDLWTDINFIPEANPEYEKLLAEEFTVPWDIIPSGSDLRAILT